MSFDLQQFAAVYFEETDEHLAARALGETDHQRGEEPPDASRREVRRAPLSRLVKTPDPPLRDHGSCEPAEEAAEEVKTEHSMSDIEAST